MTDLIPRDAAAAVCDKHSYSNNPYVSGRMADAAAEIRAIPTIDPACDHCGVDPAAIREAALREAVKSLRDWQNNLIQRLYPDSAITVGMAADVVEALIGEKK